MTDTVETTEPTNTDELSAEEKAQRIAALPEMIRDGILNTNHQIAEHNRNVELVIRANSEKKDPVLLLDELIDNDYENKDGRLVKYASEIEKLKLRVEKMYQEARKIADEVKPQSATQDEIEKAHAETKVSSEAIRTQKKALKDLASMLGQDFSVLLDEIKTTRGIRGLGGGGSESTGSSRRTSFHNIEVLTYENDEHGNSVESAERIGTEKVEKGVTVFNSTVSKLSMELNKRVKNGGITATEITEAFFAFLESKGRKYENLTVGEAFVWEFSKDVLNSEGEKIDTKTWTLRFTK